MEEILLKLLKQGVNHQTYKKKGAIKRSKKHT